MDRHLEPLRPTRGRVGRCAWHLRALALLLAFGSSASASARPATTHGGGYRGPVLPPQPGTPGGPGGAGAGGPTTGGAGYRDTDPAVWSQWWALNRDPLLPRFEGVFDAGTASEGATDEPGPGQYPSAAVRHGRVTAALLELLEGTRDPEVKTATLMALAKIGDAPRVEPEGRLAPRLQPFLKDPNQEVRETATLALGVLGDRQAGPLLAELLHDTPAGRELVGRAHVSSRTRVFAAHAVLLLGLAARHESERAWAVHHLLQAYAEDDVTGPDLRVACVLGMGLLPLESRVPRVVPEGGVGPSESLEGQLAWVIERLRERRLEPAVASFAAVAAARLASRLAPDAALELGELLLELSEPRAKTPEELREGVVHALGLLGTNGPHALDAAIRARLVELSQDGARLERHLALVALGRVLGRDGSTPSMEAVLEGRKHLSRAASDGDSAQRPWALLALGLMERERLRAGHDAALGTHALLRELFERGSSPAERAAAATAVGLVGDREGAPLLAEHLSSGDENERGHVAIALALLGATEVVPQLTHVAVVTGPPSLSREAAVALGVLGDHSAWRPLAQHLRDSRFLSVRIGRTLALGYAGDARAVPPLLEVLEDRREQSVLRAYAAVALGIVCHRDRRPWNAALAQDLPWSSAPTTLLDPATGRGVLDLF